MFKFIFCVFFVPAILLSQYVDKNATGSNNGATWENAWQSFDDIDWDIVDTLYISGDTYNESISLPLGKDNVAIIGNNTIMDGNFNLSKGIEIDGRGSVSENITIKGIEFREYSSYGVYGSGEQSGGLKNILVENCKFYDFHRAGVFFEGNGNVSGNTNIVVRNCYFDDDDNYTSQSDGIYIQYLSDFTADHNTIIIDNNYTGKSDLHSDNIQSYWVDNITYSNNILVQKSDKTYGTQMLFSEEGNGEHLYFNNVLYRDCPKAVDWAIRLKEANGGTYSCKVYNNSFVGYGKILGSDIDSKIDIKNNIFYSLDSNPNYGDGSSSNNIKTTSNPGFIDTNYNSFNLHLQSNSEAIDAGENLGAEFAYDIEKNPRTGAWDMGAYVYSGSDTQSLQSPQNINLGK